MEKLFIGHDTITDAIYYLYDAVFKSYINYAGVIGIHSGGLHVSKPLAKMLNLEHIDLRISFYGEQETPKDTPEVNFFGNCIDKDKIYLVVDDLTDSFSTFNYFNNNINDKSHFCVLYHNINNKFKMTPHYYYKEKPNEWLVFPWDM
jgi:hypoxanthine phosphoribosyltransferase